MKKKSQNPVNNDGKIDLKSVIHENSLFFDKLIELIPPRFYLPVDDKDKKWFQGLTKDEKALAKKESRENIKKARRDRLDPEKSSASTLDLLMQNLEKEKEKENDENDEDELEINPMKTGLEGHDHSATYEELRQRLQRKIEELRGGRNSENSVRAKKRNERKEFQQKKRKRETVSEDKNKNTSSVEKLENDVAEATKELKFSHVKLGTDEDHAKKKMKKHNSKVKELEKAKELQEAKNDPEKGEIISKKHSWKAATDRAAGVKVHDNPKLINLSMKKEKKRRQKNAEKWKERIESQQKMRAEKQQTRSQNIAERIQQKKMRRIAKREKKLMRAGFEGRKEGYINQPSTAGAQS